MPVDRFTRMGGAAFVLALLATPVAGDDQARARRAMVANIEQFAAAGASGGVGRLSPKVLRVMRETPRHLFVPEAERHRAYDDGALSIGHEATISQPFIVALMTDLLEVGADDRVLEVGTGSGYQAAVLSPLVRHVYTVEIVEPLATEAARRLAELGYANVTVRAGDGYAGWPEHAPFDAIMVTAGATHVPAALVAQLKSGGRLLIPLGPSSRSQRLTLVTKDSAGRVKTRRLMPVNFIPLQETAQRPHP